MCPQNNDDATKDGEDMAQSDGAQRTDIKSASNRSGPSAPPPLDIQDLLQLGVRKWEHQAKMTWGRQGDSTFPAFS